jgi:arginine/lysine/histidine transport system ATP-binding protein
MIQIINLSKVYGKKTVLKDINLTVNQGQVIAIIGPSGSGKSTLLRMINGLEKPTTGTISIDEIPLTEKNASFICRRIGMVFQLFNLFGHLTVLENITYAPIKVLQEDPVTAKSRGLQLLERVGLIDKANVYADSLSGGQKQRVAIARALAMEPEAILFDEPTSALDPEKVQEVLDVIAKLAHTGITIVLVTHEMGFARGLADRIIFMDEGKILEDAVPKAFFDKPNTARAQEFLSKVI